MKKILSRLLKWRSKPAPGPAVAKARPASAHEIALKLAKFHGQTKAGDAEANTSAPAKAQRLHRVGGAEANTNAPAKVGRPQKSDGAKARTNIKAQRLQLATSEAPKGRRKAGERLAAARGGAGEASAGSGSALKEKKKLKREMKHAKLQSVIEALRKKRRGVDEHLKASPRSFACLGIWYELGKLLDFNGQAHLSVTVTFIDIRERRLVVMSEAEVPATEPPEVNIDDFSTLVASMSRLLSGLGRLAVFSQGGISMAEWVALTMLARKDGVNNRLLARALGVTGQRANQICGALVRDGYVAITQSAADNRANEIRITDVGKAKLEDVKTQLKSMLSTSLPGKRGRALTGAANHVKNLSRALNAAESPEKKKAKKLRKAKGDGEAAA